MKFKRLVSAYVIAALIGTPFCSNMALATDFGAAGRALAEQQMGVIQSPAYNGTTGTITTQAGQTTSVQSLLGNGANNGALNKFGDDSGLNSVTQSTVMNLMTESSPQGEAYRLLKGSAEQNMNGSRPVLDDAFISSFATGLGGGASGTGFSGCTTITVTNDKSHTKHVPVIETCERVVATPPSACQVTRNVTVNKSSTKTLLSFAGNVDRSLSITFRIKESSLVGATFSGKTGAQITSSYAGQYSESESSAGDLTANVTTNPFANSEMLTGTPTAAVSLSGSGSATISLTQAPTAANGWVAKIYVDAPTAGQQAVTLSLAGQFSFVKETFSDNPAGCRSQAYSCAIDAWASSGSLLDQASTQEWSCIDADKARSISGVTITPEEHGASLQALFPGAPTMPPSPICYKAEHRVEQCAFNIGHMECFTDANGQQQCNYNDGDKPNTCGTLSANPSCAFVRSDCIEDALDRNGNCMAYTDVYDCGYDVDMDDGITTAPTTQTVCPGEFRCMGTDCTGALPNESNDGFYQVAGLLSAFNMANMDNDCAQGKPTCELFKGSSLQCKKALGGIVDCCKKPEGGVSLVDYVKLTYAAWDLAKQMDMAGVLAANGLNVAGAWSELTSQATAQWSAAKGSFMSAWDSLVGSSSVAAGGASGATAASDMTSSALGDLGVGAIKQEITNQVVGWASSAFPGAGIVGATGSGSLFVQQGSDFVLNTAAGSAGAMLSWIMTAYMIWQIVYILIKIIWKCEQSEFELGQKRNLQACHYVGTKTKKFLGIPIEKRERWCCYNSPIARIINEQARKQLSQGWGSADNPDCSGLTISEVKAINWKTMDLSEWIALLKLADKLPKNMANAAGRYAQDQVTRRLLPDGQSSASTKERTEAITKDKDLDAKKKQIRDACWQNPGSCK